MIERGYNKKVQFSCNMRFGALTREDYRLMKKAGFRMLLFGVESGSQATLDRLNKGTKIDDIMNECRIPREEGLEPHITIMVGYPWETRQDALKHVECGQNDDAERLGCNPAIHRCYSLSRK